MKDLIQKKMMRKILISMMMSMMITPAYASLPVETFKWEITSNEQVIPITSLEAADGKGKQGYTYTTRDKNHDVRFLPENEVLIYTGYEKNELVIIEERYFGKTPGGQIAYGTQTRYEVRINQKLIEQESNQTRLDE